MYYVKNHGKKNFAFYDEIGEWYEYVPDNSVYKR
jgi:hypothetical protein